MRDHAQPMGEEKGFIRVKGSSAPGARHRERLSKRLGPEQNPQFIFVTFFISYT